MKKNQIASEMANIINQNLEEKKGIVSILKNHIKAKNIALKRNKAKDFL